HDHIQRFQTYEHFLFFSYSFLKKNAACISLELDYLMPEHALLTLVFSFFFFLLAMHLINKRRKRPKKSADFASSPLFKRD
ncbi:hypothetical protein, partial [Priestia megaterium]|uniref:hypothetical protein n=1 Tax=Priestia megaterium TaxID=1404 RepID=UPI0034D3B9C9